MTNARRTMGPGILAVALLWGPWAAAAEPSGRDVAVRVRDEQRAGSEVAVFEMRIVDGKGKEKVRKLKAWTLSPADQPDRALMRFLDPPDVKGTAVLTLEVPGKEDEQWLYLPALKRTRRIAGGQRNESFMGSDLTYDDLRPVDVDAYEYRIVRSEKRPEGEAWVLEATPVKGGKAADSAYGRTLTWVRKADAVPLLSEMYDREGGLSKVVSYRDYQASSGIVRPGAIEVENRKKGSRTLLRYVERQLDGALDEGMFTTRSLETAAP